MKESGHGWRSGLHARRYSLLLVVLVAFVLLSAVVGEMSGASSFMLDMGLLAVLVMTVVAAGEREIGAPGVLLLALAIAVGDLALRASGGSWAKWTAASVLGTFLWGATLVLLSDVLRNRTLRLAERIRGAICVYFLLGLSWAFLYSTVAALKPGAFAGLTAEAGRISSQLLYYSFITLTTVGYGDITPVSELARTLAWLQAFTGQMYVAITIARLVSLREDP